MNAERLRGATAMVVFVAAWLVARSLLEIDVRFSDVPLYRTYGELVVSGEVPYRDFALEYPPGALPVFALPALVSSDPAGFRIALEVLLAACGVAVIAAVHATLVRLQAPSRRSWLALLVVAASPLLLGRVVAERYDLWPAALAAAATAAAVWGRHRAAGAALAVGTATKFFPVVLLPLLGWWAWRRDGRRGVLRLVGAFAAAALLCVLPFVAASPSGLAETVERQLERPLQIESLGSALLLALHHTVGLSLGVESSYGSINLGGTKADVVAVAQSLLLLVLLAFVWVRVARLRPRDAEDLVLASALAVTAVVVLGKVLSPQFLVWMLPFVPLVSGHVGLGAVALLAGAGVATQLVFPSRYLELIRLDETASAILIVRDLLLASLLVLLVAAFARCYRRAPPARFEPARLRPAEEEPR